MSQSLPNLDLPEHGVQYNMSQVTAHSIEVVITDTVTNCMWYLLITK